MSWIFGHGMSPNRPLPFLGHEVIAWWRHQMETHSALQTLCVGNSPVISEFPHKGPVTRSLTVFFDLRLDKRLSKQWIRRWYETRWRPSWRHCNGIWTMIKTSLKPFSTIFIISWPPNGRKRVHNRIISEGSPKVWGELSYLLTI